MTVDVLSAAAPAGRIDTGTRDNVVPVEHHLRVRQQAKPYHKRM